MRAQSGNDKKQLIEAMSVENKFFIFVEDLQSKTLPIEAQKLEISKNSIIL